MKTLEEYLIDLGLAEEKINECKTMSEGFEIYLEQKFNERQKNEK